MERKLKTSVFKDEEKKRLSTWLKRGASDHQFQKFDDVFYESGVENQPPRPVSALDTSPPQNQPTRTKLSKNARKKQLINDLEKKYFTETQYRLAFGMPEEDTFTVKKDYYRMTKPYLDELVKKQEMNTVEAWVKSKGMDEDSTKKKENLFQTVCALSVNKRVNKTEYQQEYPLKEPRPYTPPYFLERGKIVPVPTGGGAKEKPLITIPKTQPMSDKQRRDMVELRRDKVMGDHVLKNNIWPYYPNDTTYRDTHEPAATMLRGKRRDMVVKGTNWHTMPTEMGHVVPQMGPNGTVTRDYYDDDFYQPILAREKALHHLTVRERTNGFTYPWPATEYCGNYVGKQNDDLLKAKNNSPSAARCSQVPLDMGVRSSVASMYQESFKGHMGYVPDEYHAIGLGYSPLMR